MQVILTHEQADFDAIASLLGAHLLNERALPVLPRRLNRNVRAFLNLYGAEFPFVEVQDLAGETIDAVTLVDTQSLVTLKGMVSKPGVHVVDHHPSRPDLSPQWTTKIENLGACTTLFVEQIAEHNGSLSVAHATLLLLGIYEDTGALTFAGTTPRDVRAAAHLLELGASLRIAGDYLYPSLSPEQRKLYDQLLAAAETHHVHGKIIILACGSAEDMDEEISSVAHKLRDLVESDALFLLATTSDGIRMVARSTSDQINVAAIAAHFGGGGHERAAAALIKPAPDHPGSIALQETRQELICILPQFVIPPITVGQIMSKKPLVLSPQTSAEEAARLMQRYGYEGYPILKEGRVIGLLTRRAVDRALAHKLNLPVASLMEAGEVTVKTNDALDHLQRIMTSTGWGQVPVVNPDGHEIVGIVTRTDLLKTLGDGEALLPGKLNLADRLEVVLPPPRLALLRAVAGEARAQRTPLYIVGGFVRDLLLERPSLDLDLVVEGDAIALARALTRRFGGRVVSHSRFGTAKWWTSGIDLKSLQETIDGLVIHAAQLPESLDLISARTEFYDYPTALPTVERSSIKLDLHRRDFSINTMALRLDGRHYGDLYDYWGGLNDLKTGLVRVLHSLSFVDDPTRMLRAVRFEMRFNFRIEDRTRQLMEDARPLLRQVSGERLRHELDLILNESAAPTILSRLQELELLEAIHPDLKWEPKLAQPLERALWQQPAQPWELPTQFCRMPTRRVLAYLVWLAGLPAAGSQEIAKRLHLQSGIRSALLAAQRLATQPEELAAATPSQVVERLENIPIIALYAAACLGLPAIVERQIHDYLAIWQHTQPTISGKDLRSMGIKPGPLYAEILDRLRQAWLEGEIHSVQEEHAFLQKLLSNLISETGEKG